MSEDFDLIAEIREDQGKGASRRLRREGKVPAIIYGAGRPPRALTFDHNKVIQQLENESFYSSVLSVKVGDKEQAVILKDLQRHPAKDRVMHADFLRVDDKVAIKVHVPIHFVNEETSIGVKMQGGIVQHQLTDIEVQCLPGDIPEYIEVDMQDVETGQIVHLSDVTLPAGVTSVALSLGEDHDLAVASVLAPKGGGAEDDLDEAPAAADEAASDEAAEEGDSEE